MVAVEGEANVRTLLGGLRFLVGIAMVAGGVSLAMPLFTLVAAAWNAGSVAGLPPAVPSPGAPIVSPPPAVASPPVTTAGWMGPDAVWPPAVEPRADYLPPSVPERLPSVPGAVVARGPDLDATYRSTLDVPPPPLLDAQAAPPAVAAWATERPHTPHPDLVADSSVVPSVYVIHDGDDLTGIATRLYGHPGAAAALWTANRDVIPDPNLLPIGAALRVPPPWTVEGLPATSGGAPRSIEPPSSVPPPRTLPTQPVSAGSWLGAAVCRRQPVSA